MWENGKPASDLASATASALSATSIVFRDTDPAYADSLLKHAKELYAYAKKYLGKYSDAYSQTFVYSSYSYLDDLAWAAMNLYKATGDSSYLADAKSFRSNPNFLKEVYCNWDAVSVHSAIMMKCLGVGTDESNAHIDKFLNDWQKGQNGINYSPQGLAIAPLGGWGNLRHATTAAMSQLIYATCEADPAKKEAAINWARSQVDYALGKK